MNAVAEQSAKGNDVAMYGIPCFCGTCLDAASAEITLAFIYDDFFALVGNGTAAASLDADTALNAVLLTPFHLNAAFDAQVIFLRTSGNPDNQFWYFHDISFQPFLYEP